MKQIFIISWILMISTYLMASPLMPLKLDQPRDTMNSYLSAIKDYNEGLRTKNQDLINRINDAAHCFNLQSMPYIVRKEKGRTAAILLKETIDRVIDIDLSKVPNDPSLDYWRLKDTEITISKVETGERKGQFLFSPNTVLRLSEFYRKVKHLPYLKKSLIGAGYKEDWHKSFFPKQLKNKFLGIENWQWIGIFISILLGLFIKTISKALIQLVKKFTLTQTTSLKYHLVTSIEKPTALILASGFWYICVHQLKFEGFSLALLLTSVQVLFSISIVWLAYSLTDVLTLLFQKIAAKTESELDDQLVPLLSKSLRLFVAVIGVLVSIQNLGFNVMSLVAGLGLGGLAFALAAKDTAANLFGSIMILIDQPFKIGDWILTNGVEGTVEEIGFRSTRLRTFYNSLISIPNSIIANKNVDNMGQRTYRRVRAVLGLTYDTSPQKIEAFLEGVKNIIKANPYTRKDYFHVVFNGYGDFSLNILLYYFLKVPDWSEELVQKQNIFLEILNLAQKLDVHFAYPSQSLYVESMPDAEKQQAFISNQELKKMASSFSKNGENSSPDGVGIFTPSYRE